MIELSQLIAFGIAPTQARQFLDPLNDACEWRKINTPARIAGFLAQCRVESIDFTALEESLYYRSYDRIYTVFKRLRPRGMTALQKLVRNPKALANAAYAGVLGNGNEASGDGWNYRGRGINQLTGRKNYEEAGKAIGRDLLASPWLLAMPADAAQVAAWHWEAGGCNALADKHAWDAVTRKVHGPAMLKASERKRLSEAGLKVF